MSALHDDTAIWAQCSGDCWQGRMPCTCEGMRRVNTMQPAEACTEIGADDEDQSQSADKEVLAILFKFFMCALAVVGGLWALVQMVRP